jgi:hypothetical protein
VVSPEDSPSEVGFSIVEIKAGMVFFVSVWLKLVPISREFIRLTISCGPGFDLLVITHWNTS